MTETKMVQTGGLYSVDVSQDIWDALEVVGKFGSEDDCLEVIKQLEGFGAYDINWNGCFGRAVFFTIDENTNTATALKEIEKYIHTLPGRYHD